VKQQVDLYQPPFRKTETALSATSLLAIGAALIGALLLATGWVEWRAWSGSRQLASLEQRRAEEAARVVALARTHPPWQTDSALERQSADLAAERDAKVRLLRLLTNESLGNTTGFSEQVSGLARRRVPGLWLRQIRIRRGGHELSLAGSAIEPELVPRFVQQLGLEPVFAGSDFRTLRMERPEDETRRIDFTLATDEEALP